MDPNLCRHQLVQQIAEESGEGDVLAAMVFVFPFDGQNHGSDFFLSLLVG